MNTHILVLGCLGAIFVALLLVGFLWRPRGTVPEGSAAPTGSRAGKRPLTWEQIVAIPDADARYLQMGAYVTAREAEQGYNALTEDERIVFHIYSLEGEVNNGGFGRYFHSSAGDHALEAVASLRSIGARRTADHLERAIAVFRPQSPARDGEARRAQMAALPDGVNGVWDSLSEDFFDPVESLADLVAAYVGGQL